MVVTRQEPRNQIKTLRYKNAFTHPPPFLHFLSWLH